MIPKTAAEKNALRRALLAWYRRHARDLPWRRTSDPYRVWLSEIMLQQTRVEAVIPYYERFLAAFPAVRDLAAAPLDRVLKLWEGLGYYSRARNLHTAAQHIVQERGGQFPQTAVEWQALPGIGPYTAGAIASIAFRRRAAALDGNIQRVLARLFCLQESIDAPRTHAELWRCAEDLLPRAAAGDWNQALMELGATVCIPKHPRCLTCPVKNHCAAYARGVQEKLPVRRAKPPVPVREAVAAALEKHGRYLLAKRPSKGLLGGLWQLPSTALEPGQTPAETLAAFLKATFGLKAAVGPPVGTVTHGFTHFTLQLHVHRARILGGKLRKADAVETAWATPAEFEDYAFANADRKALALLRNATPTETI